MLGCWWLAHSVCRRSWQPRYEEAWGVLLCFPVLIQRSHQCLMGRCSWRCWVGLTLHSATWPISALWPSVSPLPPARSLLVPPTGILWPRTSSGARIRYSENGAGPVAMLSSAVAFWLSRLWLTWVPTHPWLCCNPRTAWMVMNCWATHPRTSRSYALSAQSVEWMDGPDARRTLSPEINSPSSSAPSPAGRRSFPFPEDTLASMGQTLHGCPPDLGRPVSASPWARAFLSLSKTVLGTQLIVAWNIQFSPIMGLIFKMWMASRRIWTMCYLWKCLIQQRKSADSWLGNQVSCEMEVFREKKELN